VTSKLQVTIPKAIAERYSIAPGDEVEWIGTSESVRLMPANALEPTSSPTERLRLFDAATQRQRERQCGRPPSEADRGWAREELYERGSSR
jgi:bifunctional DNA-binding transcriptional regulator/antitoxin component of YhaV-PrlF toxin-antitoxin module